MPSPVEFALLQVLDTLTKGSAAPSSTGRGISSTGLGSGRALSPRMRSDFETILTRLSIWAGNIGVFAPGAASLDERLYSGDHPDISDVLCHLLGRLNDALQLALEPPLQEQDHESENSESDDSDSLLSLDVADDTSPDTERWPPSKPIDRANDIVSRLYRLSTAIRKPASSRETERVRKFAQDMAGSPDLQAQAEELESLESFAQWLVCYKFSRAPKPLVNRLVSSVVFRRARLLYRRRHQSKLQQGMSRIWERGHEPRPRPERAAGAGRGMSGDVIPNLVPDTRQSPSVVFSATVASSVDRRRYQSFAKSVALSGITHKAINRRRKLDVPAYSGLVDASSGQAFCPYCTRKIDVQETKEPRWT
ncbi:hypothetical protein MMYC01_204494 [Madurella mycetomatis]|uniref:Uncharacterized protein n=1 Tax=Madurella mycetomatis TaxID=100816 RepID=A0A175W9A5_9PEZI|nr:hypothetical protein MMYC01_205289 [Madurella mycetomatis]KXX79584.1 hypothetical protein MMYC01_204494 [Madurella mycetomatis]